MKLAAAFLLIAIAAFGQVPFSRIAQANAEPGNWLSYSRTLDGQRFSPLTEINAQNVPGLKVQWAFQMPDGGTESSPVVVGAIMYITGPNSATALDTHTGRQLWTWSRPLPSDFHSIGFGHVNRGPAVLDDKLYVTTLDGYLAALDLRSGAQRWAAKVADYKLGYSLTVAPLAIKGKIVVGVSGGEAGIRGYIDAYDARSGQRAWRFMTIPGPGEPGHDTWAGESWKTGGGPAWVTGAYDPDLKLVYWGVGNPSPDWNGEGRRGDNLYTCSLVALESDTGRLGWHFQFTPHDTHDWDASHVPVLFEAEIAGRRRKLVSVANRNGFYYVLDRITGEFLAARAYTRQTWANGLDAKGRPRLIAHSEPTESGVLVWPSANGATVWFSPSYSPQTGLIYVAAREKGSMYFKRDAEYKPGTMFTGGGENELSPDDASGAIRALDAKSGKLCWEFKLFSPPWAGVLSTAGGLVFSGSDEGNFYALDAKTGKPLWNFQTGGRIGANPISFSVEGRQRIAIGADRVLYVFGL